MKELKALRDLTKETGAEVFLVGGVVRDRIRRKKPNDLDVMVRNVTPAVFEEFLRKRGSLQLVGNSFGVYLFTTAGDRGAVSIEIAFPRKEVSTGPGHRDFNVLCTPDITVEEDSERRDFTCNALYVNLLDVDENGKFDRLAVIDFHEGLEHIKHRLIVAVGRPEDRICSDPLRMLRAVVLVSRTGWRLDSSTFGAIKNNSHLLRTVSPERIRDELIKIMESGKPSRAFKTLHRCSLLEVFMPELEACVGLGQNPKYHSFNIFDHLIYATDASCKITDRLDVRFATLCHDLGKAPTRAVRPNGDGPNDVSFHNHEVESTKLAYAMLGRLKFPKAFVQDVVQLVRLHQYKYDREWTDKSVRRFIRKALINREDLLDLNSHPQFLLRQADRMGNEFKAHLPVTRKQEDFQSRIIEVYENSSAHSLKDLKIDGRGVMEELRIPAGPDVGLIMKHLFDLVEETPALNVKRTLIVRARKYLKEIKNGSNTTGNRNPGESIIATSGAKE